MDIKWTDIAQAIGSMGTLLAAIVGFWFLHKQIKQLESTLRSDTHGKLYAQSFEILQFIGAHPDVRPYIYDDKELKIENPQYNEIMCAVEIVADYLEHIALQKENIPDDIWVIWEEYIIVSYKESQGVREHLKKYKDIYTDSLFQLLKGRGITV